MLVVIIFRNVSVKPYDSIVEPRIIDGNVQSLSSPFGLVLDDFLLKLLHPRICGDELQISEASTILSLERGY